MIKLSEIQAEMEGRVWARAFMDEHEKISVPLSGLRRLTPLALGGRPSRLLKSRGGVTMTPGVASSSPRARIKEVMQGQGIGKSSEANESISPLGAAASGLAGGGAVLGGRHLLQKAKARGAAEAGVGAMFERGRAALGRKAQEATQGIKATIQQQLAKREALGKTLKAVRGGVRGASITRGQAPISRQALAKLLR